MEQTYNIMALTRLTSANAIPDDSVANVKMANIVQSKNIIINGDMQIAQRATSTASVSSNGYHTLDRWQTNLSTAGGVWTQSQDTDVPTGQGFANSIKMDCTTADSSLAAGDRCIIQQAIEGQNLQYLKKGTSSAQSLTVSFWIKSVKTGTYILELYDNDNTRQISKSYTVSSASTWEKKTVTFAGDTTGAFGNDNAASLYLNFWLAAGSTYSGGTLNTSWAANTNANRAVGQVNLADSTSNDCWITGIQMEAGDTASEFEFLPYDVNLAKCQRYYLLVVDGAGSFGTGCSITTSQFLPIVDHPVTMRANPTLSYASGSYYAVNQTGGNITVDTLALNQQNVNQTMFTMSNATFTRAGDSGVAFCLTSDAFIGLAAEL